MLSPFKAPSIFRAGLPFPLPQGKSGQLTRKADGTLEGDTTVVPCFPSCDLHQLFACSFACKVEGVLEGTVTAQPLSHSPLVFFP